MSATAMRVLIMSFVSFVKTTRRIRGSLARESGAAAQQEDDEQDGDRHTQQPEQDVAHLAFLITTQPFHQASGFTCTTLTAASAVPEGARCVSSLRCFFP